MWLMIAGFFSGLWQRFALYISLIGAFFVAIFIAMLKGRADGKAAYKAKREKAKAKAIKKARKITDDVQKANPDELDRRLDRWMRD